MKRYAKQKTLSEIFDLSQSTVCERVSEIREEVLDPEGRYDVYALSGGKVNTLIFLDWITWRKYLQDPRLREKVPPIDMNRLSEMMADSF